MSAKKTHLIVTGVARSGTTALAELLNIHPGICIGVERFKFRYLRENCFDAELFEKDRFFDFRKGDTNLLPSARPAWAPIYEAAQAKWDDAAVVGDKTPDLIPVLHDFMAQNPDFKFLCILRNLKDVGLSWQARAERTRDAWPRGRGFVAACESWANQQLILHELMRDKSIRRRLLLLDYDNMYASPDVTEQGIMQFLGLEPDPAFHDLLAEHAEFAAGKPSKKVPAKFASIYSTVDMGQARGLRKVAREQIETLASEFAARPQGEA